MFFRKTHGIGCFFTIVAVCALHFSKVYDCSKLLFLSYKQPYSERYGEELYKTGPDDLWLVTFWVVLLTAARVVVQWAVFKPLGAYMPASTNVGCDGCRG